MSDVIPESQPLHAALADFLLAVGTLQNAATRVAEQVDDDDLPRLDGDQLESAWWEIRSSYEQVEAKFAELAESAEDAMDAADGLAALREGGESISWEEIKAELGLN